MWKAAGGFCAADYDGDGIWGGGLSRRGVDRCGESALTRYQSEYIFFQEECCIIICRSQVLQVIFC